MSDTFVSAGFPLLPLRDHPALAASAARWFHACWGIPENAYRESIAACRLRLSPVPQWYLVMDGTTIVAGLGVIENDFHNRPDLAPNICAVYVEEAYRKRNIARDMLQFVCDDMALFGIGTLYLITDHTSLYERFGWSFLTMVTETGKERETRMYKKYTVAAAEK